MKGSAVNARAGTHVDRIAPDTVLPPPPLLTPAQPEDKIIGSAQLDAGVFGLSLTAPRLGDRYPAIGTDGREHLVHAKGDV
ncbi:hypothetical protein [Sphingomonas glacialis]|uniref:Uncharacterized protein n=1 Tax=Sphingomonas glacialis TaxID=658225 RepID=A0A502FXR9_9SPHN|nr:hypothetical protein [Sphingomonas glacialis]TPG54305.1 hypothetical protein EAH76_06400 [Sphingomonas glacialis]